MIYVTFTKQKEKERKTHSLRRRASLCGLLYQMTGRLSRSFLMVILSKATLKITNKIPASEWGLAVMEDL